MRYIMESYFILYFVIPSNFQCLFFQDNDYINHIKCLNACFFFFSKDGKKLSGRSQENKPGERITKFLRNSETTKTKTLPK